MQQEALLAASSLQEGRQELATTHTRANVLDCICVGAMALTERH
jgi:hypothetical protein